MEFEVNQNRKRILVNSFEIKTSKIVESRNHNRHNHNIKKRVMTNHAYLIKAVFPDARIPMKSDIIIIGDQILQKNIILPLMSLFV